jgi:trans-aconitate 2-methyltransferase
LGRSTREWDAPIYDRVSGPMQRWGANVLERLHLEGNEMVLDAGCGTGRVTAMLLERLPEGRVIALDASRKMLERASQNLAGHGRKVEFVEADLGQPLPLGEKVDAVFSTATFHWVLDHDALFTNLAAVMRPGGQLVAQCGGEGNVASVGRALAARGRDWAAWVFRSPEATTASLTAAGFVDIETWLNPEPTGFARREEMAEFLETVILAPYLEATAEDERQTLLEGVIDDLGTLELDYVRLNITARRG